MNGFCLTELRHCQYNTVEKLTICYGMGGTLVSLCNCRFYTDCLSSLRVWLCYFACVCLYMRLSTKSLSRIWTIDYLILTYLLLKVILLSCTIKYKSLQATVKPSYRCPHLMVDHRFQSHVLPIDVSTPSQTRSK